MRTSNSVTALLVFQMLIGPLALADGQGGHGGPGGNNGLAGCVADEERGGSKYQEKDPQSVLSAAWWHGNKACKTAITEQYNLGSSDDGVVGCDALLKTNFLSNLQNICVTEAGVSVLDCTTADCGKGIHQEPVAAAAKVLVHTADAPVDVPPAAAPPQEVVLKVEQPALPPPPPAPVPASTWGNGGGAGGLSSMFSNPIFGLALVAALSAFSSMNRQPQQPSYPFGPWGPMPPRPPPMFGSPFGGMPSPTPLMPYSGGYGGGYGPLASGYGGLGGAGGMVGGATNFSALGSSGSNFCSGGIALTSAPRCLPAAP
jgi:hypothetical protein